MTGTPMKATTSRPGVCKTHFHMHQMIKYFNMLYVTYMAQRQSVSFLSNAL